MNGGRQTAVGAFVLGGILLAVGAVIFFGKFNIFNPSIRAVIVFQDSIAGLSIGSPVTFRGVPVGSVESIGIRFDPKTSSALIPVGIRLEPDRARIGRPQGSAPLDLEDLIKRGLRAELNMQSFVTGQAQIDLDFDPGSETVLHPGISDLPEIPTKQSAIQMAKEQLSQLPWRELADNTNATLQSLKTLSEKLEDDLPPLVDSLKTTSDRSAQLVETAGQAIKSLQGSLDSTLANINRLTTTADGQLNARGADLHTLMTVADESLVRARDVLGDLRTVTSSRSVDRANLESTLRDLAAAAAAFRGFASDVERNPQLLLTGRRP
jgi:paraquat-inducible protein B